MQRKSFGKLFLIALGYMVFGNLLSTIMTISIAVVANVTFVQVIAFIFTTFIFYSLIFTAAYKDGVRERKMVHLKKVDEPNKMRWVNIGLLLWLVMALLALALFVDKAAGLWYDFLLVYRIVCGAVYPLSLLICGNTIDDMAAFVPLIFMAYYALIPLACRIGFKVGYEDKFNPDSIMYQKKQ